MNYKSNGKKYASQPETRFHLGYLVKENGCWEWQMSSRTGSNRGYGRITVNKKTIPAHRYSWMLFNNQDIPKGYVVMHSCDNSICVNPHHLSIGTHQDNMNDMVNKNRQAKGGKFKNRKSAKGSKNGLAKLTEINAKKIYMDKRPQRVIAKDYGISQAVVSNIKLKKTWRLIHE